MTVIIQIFKVLRRKFRSFLSLPISHFRNALSHYIIWIRVFFNPKCWPFLGVVPEECTKFKPNWTLSALIEIRNIHIFKIVSFNLSSDDQKKWNAHILIKIGGTTKLMKIAIQQMIKFWGFFNDSGFLSKLLNFWIPIFLKAPKSRRKTHFGSHVLCYNMLSLLSFLNPDIWLFEPRQPNPVIEPTFF